MCVAVTLTAVTHDPWPTDDGLGLVLLSAFAAVGVVIARRQPRNAVGWLLIGVGLVAMFQDDVKLYLILDYRLHHGNLPLGSAAVYWAGAYSLLPILFGLPAILLFPDGRTSSRRWRRLLQVYLALAVLFMVAQSVGQASVSVGRHVAIDIRGNLPNGDTGGSIGEHCLARSPRCSCSPGRRSSVTSSPRGGRSAGAARAAEVVDERRRDLRYLLRRARDPGRRNIDGRSCRR